MKKIKQIITGYILWIWYYLYKPYRDKRKEEAGNPRRIDALENGRPPMSLFYLQA